MSVLDLEIRSALVLMFNGSCFHFCRESVASMRLPCSLNVKGVCEKLKKVDGGNLKKDDAVKKMKFLSK